jgi:hypothetical protein
LRKSCYNCKFKKLPHKSDITLGDFWGVKKKYPKTYNKYGTSIIIINSNKGKELLDEIKKTIFIKEVKFIKFVLKHNPCINESINGLNRRKNFFKDLDTKGFTYVLNKYMKG